MHLDHSHAHHHHPQGHGGASSPAGLATSATLHCLTGCAVGEFVGLLIGVALGLHPWTTTVLSTFLSYVSGFSFGLMPLVRQGMSVAQAFKTIWLGEAISIGVMEVAMNLTDYHVGGMTTSSVFSFQFWFGYAVALPAGFLAAWPVNWWLLKSSVKKPCH